MVRMEHVRREFWNARLMKYKAGGPDRAQARLEVELQCTDPPSCALAQRATVRMWQDDSAGLGGRATGEARQERGQRLGERSLPPPLSGDRSGEEGGRCE